MRHLSFKCVEVAEEIKGLKTPDMRVLAEPCPGEAFGNEKIAFAFTQQRFKIELVDMRKRAGQVSRQLKYDLQ